MAATEDDEDDYLAMGFADPPAKENSLQRTARLKREAAARGIVPSKKELQAKGEKTLQTGLATQLDSSNRGAQMLAKMGFKGGALGKSDNARTTPIEVEMRVGKAGIGTENHQKRKFREAAEEVLGKEKRVKMTEEEFRERSRVEREERQFNGQLWAAMRVCEELETGEMGGEGGEVKEEQPGKVDHKHTPLHSINVLWRRLPKSRLEKEKEKSARNDLMQSLSRRTDYNNDPEAEEQDKIAFGEEVEEDLDEADPELEQFEELPLAERVEKLVAYLREKHYYCFWCKYRYPDEALDGCPGLTEDEHG